MPPRAQTEQSEQLVKGAGTMRPDVTNMLAAQYVASQPDLRVTRTVLQGSSSQAERLTRWAFDALRRQEDCQGHDILRLLDTFTANCRVCLAWFEDARREFRKHGSGDQFIDANVVGPELHRQTSCQHPDARLGRVVGTVSHSRLVAHARANVNDRPAACLLQRSTDLFNLLGGDQSVEVFAESLWFATTHDVDLVVISSSVWGAMPPPSNKLGETSI